MGIEKICMTNKVNKIKIPKMICGLDEAGRGALAGPIVIAGVVLYSGFNFKKISPNIVVKDSKELSNKQREYLFNIIKKHCHRIIIEVISVKDINERGINWANIEGFRRIIKKIQADKYLIDGRWKLPDLREKNKNTKCIIKGDTKVMAILSAGVVAKIKRDKIMQKLHLEYPNYCWNTNTGHGTEQHIGAIKKFGSCKYHKKQFVETALSKFNK